MLKRTILGVLLLSVLAASHADTVFARNQRVIDDNDTVAIRGNVHPKARPEFDSGATDQALPMARMVLSLHLPSDRKADLERLLSEQKDPASANYHRWLTPEEFSVRFGPSDEDVSAITGWLTSHGFTVDEVPRGRTSINFSGKVSHVERAFRTRIRDYVVDGKLYHANESDPEIPRGLADRVGGIVSLHNFPRKAMNGGIRPLPQADIQPGGTFGSNHYLSPGDFAAIYNVNPLYAAGIDGTGQSIAIVGRTHPSSTNWTTFRSAMGLPAKAVQVIVNGTDPGDQGAGENGEADLDVEWSGAVAKNATIKFVTSKSTYSTDGVDLSAQYIVNNDLAPVMSTSFGLCESLMGSTENSFYNNLWQQAAAQGITSFVSSGDSGAAGCSSSSATSGSGRGVNGLGSTPYNVAVGGTQFSDGAGGYWNSSNGAGYTSAVGYIPETAWNESGNVSGGSELWSTGGGVSLYYSKPSWQVAPGVPADGMRDVPDVSLTAAGHVGYLVQTQNALYAMSGTSASSPAFAGLMALIVQKTGQRQGNANIRLYQLGNAQYNSGGPAIFHDTTSGNNSVPGVVGYSCTAGYDLVTGLGSVDAFALANNWVPPASLLLATSNSLPTGTTGTPYSQGLSATGGTSPYVWSVVSGTLPTGLSLNGSTGLISGTPSASGVFTFDARITDVAAASITRTFTIAISSSACASWPVLIPGVTPAYYPDFPSAYQLAADGNTIELQGLNFSSDILLDRDLGVTLRGGYDCGYTANAATTGLLGNLRVSNGTVKVDKLRFM